MKKHILTGLLALATAFGAMAETVTIGKWLGDSEEGSTAYPPFNIDYAASGSQTIYTPEILAALNDQSDMDYALISQIRVPFTFSNACYNFYWDETYVPATFTVYASIVDDNGFVADSSGKYTWLPFEDGIKGTGTLDMNSEGMAEGAYEGYCEAIIAINFETPIKYTVGDNLMLTWVCETPGESEMWQGPHYVSKVTPGIHSLSTIDATMTGSTKDGDSYVPTIELTFTKHQEVPAVTYEPMDAAESTVGNWTSSTCSSNEELPFDTDYESSSSQAIYTPALLPDLNSNPDYAYVEISSLTVPVLLNENCAFASPFMDWLYSYEKLDETAADFKVFATTTDASEYLPDANGDYNFYPYSDGVVGTGSINADCENIANVGYDTFYVTVNFATPIKYVPGENLVITWESTSVIAENYHEAGYCTNPKDGKKHSVYNSHLQKEVVSSAYYPSFKLAYTPYKQVGGATKPALSIPDESVKFTLDQVQVADGVKNFSDLSLVNRISLDFDIVDESEAADVVYTVKFGNVEQTTTDRHVTISYLSPAVADLNVSVSAEGHKPVIKTIATAPVADLFPQPEVSLDKATYYVETDPNYSSRVNLHAAARFNMGTDGYAAMARGDNNIVISQYTELPEELAEYEYAAGDNKYSHLHENNHMVSCYIRNIKTIDIVDGVYDLTDGKANITAKLHVVYPVVVASSKDGILTSASDSKAPAADGTVISSSADFALSTAKTVEPSNSSYSGVTFSVPYADGGLTGIEDITVDNSADTEIFNLQGVKVGNQLTPGIYIMRQGATTSKVIVK